MDLASSLLIVFAFLLVLIVLSACCKSVRQSCESQLTNAELARRRQAIYLSQVNRVPRETRVVRVATIERDNNHVAYEVYEIQFPPNSRPSNGQRAQIISQARRHRPQRPRRARDHPELRTPPPPFRTALEVSTPVASCYSQPVELEEPPPSYDDYMKEGKNAELDRTEHEDKERY